MCSTRRLATEAKLAARVGDEFQAPEEENLAWLVGVNGSICSAELVMQFIARKQTSAQ